MEDEWSSIMQSRSLVAPWVPGQRWVLACQRWLRHRGMPNGCTSGIGREAVSAPAAPPRSARLTISPMRRGTPPDAIHQSEIRYPSCTETVSMPGRPTIFHVAEDAASRDQLAQLPQSGMPWRVESYATMLEFLRVSNHDRHGCLIVDLRQPTVDSLEILRLESASPILVPVILLARPDLDSPGTRGAQTGRCRHRGKAIPGSGPGDYRSTGPGTGSAAASGTLCPPGDSQATAAADLL